VITVILAVNTILLAYLAFRWRGFMIEQFKVSDEGLNSRASFLLAKLGTNTLEINSLRQDLMIMRSAIDNILHAVGNLNKPVPRYYSHVNDALRYMDGPIKHKNKGKKLTAEQKKALSDNAKAKWASYTPEQREARIGGLRSGHKKAKKAAPKGQPVESASLVGAGGNVSNPV
jgi:hypothetical protein